MKGITAIDKCEVCGGGFAQGNNHKCPEHKTTAQRFRVTVFYKGGMYRRTTTLNGVTLTSIQQANALYQKAIDDIKAKKFNPDKWKSKGKYELQFDYLIDKWLKEKKQLMERGKIAPSYLPKLDQYVRLYFSLFFEKTDVTDIFTFKDFALWLPNRLSPKYQKNILDALKGFFRWLKEDKIIDELPKFHSIEVPEHNFKVIGPDTQALLLSLIPDAHKPIFTFLFYQGCRPSEARALKWKDIEADTVTICRTWSNHVLREQTKTRRVRPIYLFPDVAAALPRKEFPDNFVFQHGKQLRRPYSKTFLNKIFKQACSEIGLEISLYEATKHSWSTAQYRSGISLKLIQKYHGHSSEKMTERYTKIDVVDTFRDITEKRRALVDIPKTYLKT